MSGGGDSDTFLFDLKNFASILQAHSRGTLCTSQTSDKQQQTYNINNFYGYGGGGWDISPISARASDCAWNAWDSRSMRESWQLNA